MPVPNFLLQLWLTLGKATKHPGVRHRRTPRENSELQTVTTYCLCKSPTSISHSLSITAPRNLPQPIFWPEQTYSAGSVPSMFS